MLVALTCPRVYSLDGKVKDSLCGTPGIIIPSQGVIIYFKSHGDPVVELEVSKEYVLTCKVPDLLYRQSSDKLDREKFLQNAVTVLMAHKLSSQNMLYC